MELVGRQLIGVLWRESEAKLERKKTYEGKMRFKKKKKKKLKKTYNKDKYKARRLLKMS